MKATYMAYVATAVIMGASVAPVVAADAAAGAKKVTLCSVCHGADGQSSVPIYPNLAGQSAAYLDLALKAYRAGDRNGGMSAVMTPQVKNLSDEDIADISAYYSEQ